MLQYVAMLLAPHGSQRRTTPAGKALFQMMGVFAEFERAMLQERVKAGLARAKAQGKTFGRPRISREAERAIRDARAAGKSIRVIAREQRVAPGTVQRVIRQET